MTKRRTPCCCDVCGVSSFEKPVMFSGKYNKFLCGKHRWELDKFGEIKNPTKYNRFDKNRYRIDNGIVYMDICDAYQTKICETLFDERFLDLVIDRKWRITYKNKQPYITTKATEDEGTAHTTLHRYIAKISGMDIDGMEIDHINGDTMDNRLCNLRLATRLNQAHNVSPKSNNKLGIRGVCYSKRDCCYKIDFLYDHRRYYFKHFKTLPEAVYARYLMEKAFFDDVAVERHLPTMQPYIDQLSDAQKCDIKVYISDIIQRKEARAS